MKIRLPIILIFIIFFCKAFAQKPLVKTQKTFYSSYHDGMPDTIRRLERVRVYDQRGNVTLETNYSSYPGSEINVYDSVESKYEYKFDEKNRLVERNYYSENKKLPWSMTRYSYETAVSGLDSLMTTETTQSFDDHKTFSVEVEIETYAYDVNNRKITETTRFDYGDHDLVRSKSFIRDDKGNVITITTKWADEKKARVRSHYKYDERGNRISYEGVGPFGCGYDIAGWTRKYDDKDRIVEECSCYAAKKLGCDTKRYSYSDNGTMQEETSVREAGNERSVRYFYNENNQLLKEIHYSNNKPWSENSYEYEYY